MNGKTYKSRELSLENKGFCVHINCVPLCRLQHSWLPSAVVSGICEIENATDTSLSVCPLMMTAHTDNTPSASDTE